MYTILYLYICKLTFSVKNFVGRYLYRDTMNINTRLNLN